MTGNTFDLPDADDIKAIAAVIKDISDQMTKIAAMRDYIKEAKKDLKETHGIPADVVAKEISLYHKQNSTEEFEKQEDIELFYDKLFPTGDSE